VRLHLSLAGFQVTDVDDGAKALAIVRAERFDIIVTDVALPGVDGLTLCGALRSHGPNIDTPLLIVTSRVSETDKVLGLESGADDYITKPAGMRELIARVHALLRRVNRGVKTPPAADRAIRQHGVLVDAHKRTAIVNGHLVDLTKQEFDLLHLLLSSPGVVFTREALLSRLKGSDTYVTQRTVDAVISRLRYKLETDPRKPGLILTAWGVGYKCADVQ